MIPLPNFVHALLAIASLAMALQAAANCPPLLNHSVPRLQDGAPQSLCQYQGKVILVLNTASYCGFTGQYDGLQNVYDKYKSCGLVVIGFPSNDFGDQEPGSNQQIAEFSVMRRQVFQAPGGSIALPVLAAVRAGLRAP